MRVSGRARDGEPADRIRHTQGTWRIRAPNETLAAVLPRARAAGVTRLATITHLDRIGLPVVMAIRPASRGLSVWSARGSRMTRHALRA